MAIKIDNQTIKDYYNKNQILYNLFLSDKGMHYGFWGKNTKRLSDAVENENRFVSECLGINKDDVVLDAGCGVGGTTRFIAEEYRAKTFGITLSDVQLKIAKQKSLKSNAADLISFFKKDFTKTDFKDKSFSKIFGIESICHARNKLDFLKEAFRLLKKGGKISIADGFQVRSNLNNKEKKLYEKWLKGWAVPNLATLNSCYNDFKKAGFKKIKYYDNFNEIKKTRDRLYRLGFWNYPLSWFLYKLGIFSKNMHDNTISCIYQKEVFSDTNNIATYGVFVAEK